MRRALAGISLAATLMVALSFLVPLALLVREQARDRVTTAAEQRAAALSPVLALTTRRADVQQAVSGLGSDDRLAVRLPDGGLVGTLHAPQEALKRAVGKRETLALDTAEGWVYLQPVVLAENRVAVVEAYVPAGDLTRGVWASWGVMSLLALGLVGGSVLVADRLGARVVRSSRSLKRARWPWGRGTSTYGWIRTVRRSSRKPVPRSTPWPTGSWNCSPSSGRWSPISRTGSGPR